MRYRVSALHAQDIATGAVFAPGEVAVGVNSDHPHDRDLIDRGVLVPIQQPAKRTQKEEKSK